MTTDQAPASSRHTVYSGRTTNWPMVVATSAFAILLIVLGSTGEGDDGGWGGPALPIVLVTVGVLAEVLTGSSVRAFAGTKGLDIRWGLVGWPRCTYALDQIARAEVIDLPWWRVSFGLWWTPRRTSCTIRSGPTLRLLLTNGRIVTVTVPDPELAARALVDAGTSPATAPGIE